MARICHFCQKAVDLEGKIQFREECPHCRRDLHICLNCRDYDPNAYHQCREPMAGLINDKKMGNFCDYFKPSDSPATGSSKADEARKKLDDLFKK